MSAPSQPLHVSTDGAALPGTAAAEESLIQYPCLFPIKVLGSKIEGFEAAIAQVVKQFDPNFDEQTMATKVSSGGHYLGLTVTITATSRMQLDTLYRALSTHPMVKWVL